MTEIRRVAGVPSGPRRVGVAVSRFNAAITERLLAGALAALERIGVEEVVVLEVPGALELPLAARSLAESGCAAVVAIGAVIQGETDHYEVVAREANRGLMEVGVQWRVPIGNAVLTVRDYAHAVERSEPGPGNKGAEAAEVAVETLRSLSALRSERQT